MHWKKPAMEFFKDRNRWSIILAALFLLAVLSTVFYLYDFSKTHSYFQHDGQRMLVALYSGLAMIFFSGALALWVTFGARKEVMIYREKERDDLSLSGHLLTVSQNVTNPGRETARNGNPSEVITI